MVAAWALRFINAKNHFFSAAAILQRAHDFYEKYGGKTVILARFVPIVRTFCPPVAGAAGMPYARYLTYDIFGGILWVGSMILGGYALGRSIPNIGQKIHYVIAVVVVLSLLPAVIGVLRERRKAKPKLAGKGLKQRIGETVGVTKRFAQLFLISGACWCAWILPEP